MVYITGDRGTLVSKYISLKKRRIYLIYRYITLIHIPMFALSSLSAGMKTQDKRHLAPDRLGLDKQNMSKAGKTKEDVLYVAFCKI